MSVIPFDRERPFPLRGVFDRVKEGLFERRVSELECRLDAMIWQIGTRERSSAGSADRMDPMIRMFIEDQVEDTGVVHLSNAG